MGTSQAVNSPFGIPRQRFAPAVGEVVHVPCHDLAGREGELVKGLEQLRRASSLMSGPEDDSTAEFSPYPTEADDPASCRWCWR
jgi:hypothetical protein